MARQMLYYRHNKNKNQQDPITKTRFSSTHNKNKTCECSKLIFLENGNTASERTVRRDARKGTEKNKSCSSNLPDPMPSLATAVS